MDWRRVATFVAINAIVSAVVTLLVLSWWETRRPNAAPATSPAPTSIPATLTAALPGVTPAVSTSTQSPAPTPTPAPTSGPFVYQIQQGDTLGSLSLEFDVPLEDLLAANGLTEDTLLTVGQEITIPIGGAVPPAATPRATASASNTPAATSGPALVIIREIVAPGRLNEEAVILSNLGELTKLTGWTLSDGDEHRYTFPDVTLFAGAEINLHTRAGTDTPSDLHWGDSAARWGETGTIAYLRDASGKLVATYRVP